MTSAEATADVLNKQLPAVVATNEAGSLNMENIDMICEMGILSQ